MHLKIVLLPCCCSKMNKTVVDGAIKQITQILGTNLLIIYKISLSFSLFRGSEIVF